MSILDSPPATFSSSPRHRVKTTIHEWIRRGDLRVGDRVPAELKLAEQLKVSRNSVRASLTELEEEGVLRGEKNRSRVVAKATRAQSSWVSRTVAVLTKLGRTDIEAPTSMVQVGAGARHGLAEVGYHVLDLHRDQLEIEQQSALISEPPRGILVVEGDGMLNQAGAREFLQEIKNANIPFVVSGENAALHGYDRVSFGHRKGGELLTRACIERGCKRIVMVGSMNDATKPEYGWMSARINGYRDALNQAQLEVQPYLEMPDFLPRDGKFASAAEFEGAVRMLVSYLAPLFMAKQRPDALLFDVDQYLYLASAACALMNIEPGLNAGSDVILGGYDNNWANASAREYASVPPAITVDKDNEQVGRLMTELLMQRIAGELPDEPQLRNATPKLVEIAGDCIAGDCIE